MTYFAEMIHRRLHLHDKLEHLHGVARLFKELNGHLAYFRRRVIELRQEKPQTP